MNDPLTETSQTLFFEKATFFEIQEMQKENINEGK